MSTLQLTQFSKSITIECSYFRSIEQAFKAQTRGGIRREAKQVE
jgi:hypothetical protein